MRNGWYLWMTLTVSVVGCSVKPEPIEFGKDACYVCKMTLVDRRFGAELVTKKGKIYKFDDLRCFADFYRSGVVPESDIHQALVVDFAEAVPLVVSTEAIFVRSDAARSPMGGGVAAFSSTVQANQQLEDWKGQLIQWGEIIQ